MAVRSVREFMSDQGFPGRSPLGDPISRPVGTPLLQTSRALFRAHVSLVLLILELLEVAIDNDQSSLSHLKLVGLARFLRLHLYILGVDIHRWREENDQHGEFLLAALGWQPDAPSVSEIAAPAAADALSDEVDDSGK